MKESVRSLQAYFIVVSLLAGYSNATTLIDENQPFMLLKILAAVGLAFAVAFLVAGLTLKKVLVTASGSLLLLVVCQGIFTLVKTALALWLVYDIVGSAMFEMIGWMPLLWPGLTVLICVYLFASVKRLAREAKAAAVA